MIILGPLLLPILVPDFSVVSVFNSSEKMSTEPKDNWEDADAISQRLNNLVILTFIIIVVSYVSNKKWVLPLELPITCN